MKTSLLILLSLAQSNAFSLGPASTKRLTKLAAAPTTRQDKEAPAQAADVPIYTGQGAAVAPATAEADGIIPGFKGKVYPPTDAKYDKMRHQYATPSFDDQMKPAMIAYPEDVEDVQAAIAYAQKARQAGQVINVMGRSGGHQYCGVSCENDAVCLSLDNFNEYTVADVEIASTWPDGRPRTVTKELTLGVGCVLKNIVDNNLKNGFTFPHGECPGVGIGGHMQTGGFGHLTRNFGLCLDYVDRFEVVLADGTHKWARRHATDPDEQDLFRAVLGGSPGAFGVVTRAVFHPIVDAEFPRSTGYCKRLPVASVNGKDHMLSFFEFCRGFANRAMPGDADQLTDQIDCEMTVVTHGIFTWFPLKTLKTVLPEPLAKQMHDVHVWGVEIPLPTVLIAEMSCQDIENGDNAAQWNALIEDYEKTVVAMVPKFELWWTGILTDILVSLAHRDNLNGVTHYPLSEISYEFARGSPEMTIEGKRNDREFGEARPYNKATYGTRAPLPAEWTDAFGGLIWDVHDTGTKDGEDVHVMFQSTMGGAKVYQQSLTGETGLPQRDYRFMGSFDLFRAPASKDAAIAYQDRYRETVVEPYMANDPKIMQTWASREGELDLDDPKIWTQYYNKPEDYHALREIKRKLDPDDLFHSKFTLRPAEH